MVYWNHPLLLWIRLMGIMERSEVSCSFSGPVRMEARAECTTPCYSPPRRLQPTEPDLEHHVNVGGVDQLVVGLVEFRHLG